MLMILTSKLSCSQGPNRNSRTRANEPCAAAPCRSRDSPSRLRRHDCIPAWRDPACRAEGNVAPSHARLDLGEPDGVGGGQFVLDPSDPADRSLEPDPFAVDLHTGDAPTGRMDGAPSPGCG